MRDLAAAMGIPGDAFHGRTALVTGGARGIGEATARMLSALGARVGVLDLLDAPAAHWARRCDVADPDQLLAAIDACEAALGSIDVLVNSAGFMALDAVTAISLERWDRSFAVNSRAPFLAMRRVLPAMIAQRSGVVVNLIGSDGGRYGSAFSGSKAALRSLGHSANAELDGSGVSVVTFLPGVVDTPNVRELLIPELGRLIGFTEQEAIAAISLNPGYAGLLPVELCAAALAYVLQHAAEYRGQIADAMEPLARHGLVARPESTVPRAPGPRDGVTPPIGEYIEQVNLRNRDLEQRIAIRTRELAEAHARSEELLLNILPRAIADRLKTGTRTIADHFDEVTVLFADLVGFTTFAAHRSPEDVVRLLDEVFSAFDETARRLGLEKIKTIGDCYMLVGGLPVPRADATEAVARAALELGRQLARVDGALRCRIGMHVGPVVAGVIGKHKFIYDLWGDTVNTASRMESQGEAGRIQCSDAVRARLADRFVIEDRGELDVKGKGKMRTYFLVGER